jgi:hypothetical protein
LMMMTTMLNGTFLLGFIYSRSLVFKYAGIVLSMGLQVSL